MIDNALVKNAKDQFNELITTVDSLDDLDVLEIKYLSKKGVLSSFMSQLRNVPAEDRRAFGIDVNELKKYVKTSCVATRDRLYAAQLEKQLENEYIDVTLPERVSHKGKIHPISHTLNTICSHFQKHGFDVADGPEIEDEEHNFGALNIPENHPARQMHDTFYVNRDQERMVLRTHTSPVQIRYMRSHTPPMRIIAPGRVYRHDSDQTHTPMFHQLEGLYVDKKVSFGQLKACIEDFLSAFLKQIS